MAVPANLVGQRFGRLTVTRIAPVQPGRGRFWVCACDCGDIAINSTESLRAGKTQSCGCLIREHATRLGKANTGKTGELSSNWRGGPKLGACTDCGKPTWDISATLCKACYVEYLKQRTGPANPEWGVWSSTNPQQGRDRAGRRKKLGICERCRKVPAVDRHHKDGNPLNNRPDNIKGLCRRCHMTEDGRLAKLTKRKGE